MKLHSQHVRLSATDVSNHLACRDVTHFDLAVALGERAAPAMRIPDLWVLQELGLRHEQAYLDSLARTGLSILNLADIGSEEVAQAETVRAMEKGIDVIAQATLTDGRWFGRADVLRRTAADALRASQFACATLLTLAGS
jgi:hypothetical protein